MRILDPRSGLDFLDPDECLALLAERSGCVGRVAFVEGEHPVVLPVNYVLDGNRIAFRTAEGAKLSMSLRGAAASFEVDQLDDEIQTGWSVLVRGHAQVVAGHEEVARLAALGLRTWAGDGAKTEWVVIPIDVVTGRRIELLTTR
jgi:nitroimidazol reductase NimA-like FMN-containing flavoprotein (pyridoxamine 5'-phosphate oxidase superfamily)